VRQGLLEVAEAVAVEEVAEGPRLLALPQIEFPKEQVDGWRQAGEVVVVELRTQAPDK
jgi:hypothetical protein